MKLFKGTETLIDDFPLDDPVSSLDTVVAPDSPLISSASKISQSTENGESWLNSKSPEVDLVNPKQLLGVPNSAALRETLSEEMVQRRQVDRKVARK